jgi:hypothetical protein
MLLEQDAAKPGERSVGRVVEYRRIVLVRGS